MEENVYIFYSETFSSRIEEEKFKFDMRSKIYAIKKNINSVEVISIIEKTMLISKYFKINKPDFIILLGCNHYALESRVRNIIEIGGKSKIYYTKKVGIKSNISDIIEIDSIWKVNFYGKYIV